MLRKDTEVKWNIEAKQSFDKIKQALTHASMLISPKFTKYFLIFSFSSQNTIVAILLQKNNEGHAQPIAFFSKVLIDVALKYNIMEKQVFSLVKSIKYFIFYILHSHIISFVPNVVVKYILTRNDPEGKRGKWISIILEYYIEIKPFKLIKGQGVAKLMIK